MYKLEEIAAAGDDLATLKALRQKIAATIDESKSGRDIAALSRQLNMVIENIRELEAQDTDETISELIENHRGQTVRKRKVNID